MLWEAGLGMWAANPLFGVGPGNFGATIHSQYSYLRTTSGILASAAHSLYIETIAELGLAGALPVFALVFLFLRLNARTRKLALASDAAGRRSFEYCLASGLDLAMMGYLVSGAFLSVLYYPHLWVLLGLSVGTHTACVGRQTQESSESRPVRERKLPLAMEFR
jgi:O-antigen ligase